MSFNADGQKSISDLFLEAFQINTDVQNGATGSDLNQDKIKHALNLLDMVINRTDELRLFSDNEEIEEISTVNLKYLLSPAVRGVLTSLVQTPREERKPILVEAEGYLHQFLLRCRDYAIGPLHEIDRSLKQKDVKKAEKNARDLASLNAKRELKIARFKRDKELEARLKEYKALMMTNTDNTNGIDEDVVRKYWLSMLEKWVDVSIENIESLADENEMLDFWEKMPDKNNPPPLQQSSSQNGAAKNFILTRDKVQAQVFGAGYPSLPAMTVEQYFESQVAQGCLPDQVTKPASNGQAANSDDEDNDEKLKKQRGFDDWKDTHRRGEGNRKNMG